MINSSTVEEYIAPPTGTITEWTDDQWNNFKTWLSQVLRNNIVEVVFTKTDNTERVMNCTLRGELIVIKPVTLVDEVFSEDNLLDLPKRKRAPVKPIQGNITVFDIDQVAWRSFRVRNITNIYSLMLKYGAP